jgi:hypothetical protein
MFKRMFRLKKQSDIRFLPYEKYRAIKKNELAINQEETHAWMNSRDALKVAIESPDAANTPVVSIDQFLPAPIISEYSNEEDSFIRVEEKECTSDIKNKESIYKLAHVEDYFFSNNVKYEPVSSISEAKSKLSNSLGVFSDTKIYSALISSELKKHSVNLKYFNHPKNFISSQYPFFDDVSAWIVFLSEDADDGFLETFIDRYIDKPCLFLFEKGNRNKTGLKVSRFLEDNHLITSRYSSILSEV